MRLLIDNALSPKVAALLAEAGYEVLHVRDIGMQAAADEEILARATSENRIIVSADTDFGALLAARGTSKPSFVLLRCNIRRPDEQAAMLVANLPALAEMLAKGAIAVVEDHRIRIRHLPIGESPAE
jgi:predicted nuclease of predicted toxin-antitoxin system